MYHSIRWRLIFSYSALALLTIALIGIVAISLVTRYMASRENETLTANAEAVARMAGPLLLPPFSPARLQQLAITSSFLTNTDLQILGPGEQVLADSQLEPAGSDSARATLRMMQDMPRGDWDSHQTGLVGPFIIVSGRGHPRGMFALNVDRDDFRNVITAFSVERRPGPWGGQLIVEESTAAARGESAPAAPADVHADRPLSQRMMRMLFGDAPYSAEFGPAGPAVTVPVRHSGQVVGYVQMSNRFPISAEPLQAIRRSLIAAGLGAVLVAVLLGYLMSRTLTAPLMTLQGAAQRMEGGDLTARAPESGGEIGDLSLRFNRMAARLQATFADLSSERDALRRFIADASHELRTPLTALRQFVEILQGQAGAEPDTRADFLAESQRQLDRLQWITGHLLDLSRLDGGVASLDITRHDAGDLLESALAPFRSLAVKEGIELRLAVADDLEAILCDRASLEIALANLLDNALKYTPSGGTVELAASEEAGRTVLAVSDTGPGIDAADGDRVFERFYRGQGSGAQPGAGLGLAIVKSAAEAHGGRVRLEGDAGASFFIEIPSSRA
ncbi:MAG: HAMP domain-containing sensor histidine kinase [Caldilineaceae bacterium]|nr:HAMP domain-containing sensor histidine kinase [Caldilineaceae bacterium]